MAVVSNARKVLACLLVNPTWIVDASSTLGVLAPAAFVSDAFDSALWSSLVDHHERCVDVTPMDVLAAVTAKTENVDALKEVRTLMDLAALETRASFERRLAQLHQSTYQRVAREGVQKLVAKAEGDEDFDWVGSLALAENELVKRQRRDARNSPVQRGDLHAAMRRPKVRIPTGFRHIDPHFGGFVVGGTTLVLMRTNAGKSSFLYACAANQVFERRAMHLEAWRQEQPHGLGNPYEYWVERRKPGYAKLRDRDGRVLPTKPPHVLLLSVEDDRDDYLARFASDMANIHADDLARDPMLAIRDQDDATAVDKVDEVIACGRLTIRDYEQDGDEDKSIASIMRTIDEWVRITRSRCKDEGDDDPPLLVLLDYFQKIQAPDLEKVVRDERRVLAKVSNLLYNRAKKMKFALCMAVMLLRADEHVEPDKEEARGGSDAVQDADATLIGWPFGARERAAIEDATIPDELEELADYYKTTSEMGVHLDPVKDEPANDTPFDSDDSTEGDEFESAFSGEEEDEGSISRTDSREAQCELLLACDKNRRGDTGWTVPLHFQREYKRIIDARDPRKIWRRDPTVHKILKDARKARSKAKKS